MKNRLLGIACGLMVLATVGVTKADVAFSITSPEGITVGNLTLALADASWVQVWYSSDALTIMDFNGGNVDLASAQATVVGFQDAFSNDIMVFQDVTTGIAGFVVGGALNGSATDADVALDGGDINVGYLYSIVYNSTTAPALTTWASYSSVAAGPFGDSLSVPPPFPTDLVFVGSSPHVIDGSYTVVEGVPEPGTFALFALGLATIAWRRRKK